MRRILSWESESDVEQEFETMTFVVRLGATLFFVLLNGFFVAAEFAFVKVRGSRIETLACTGSGRAKMAQKILDLLYLSDFVDPCYAAQLEKLLVVGSGCWPATCLGSLSCGWASRMYGWSTP